MNSLRLPIGLNSDMVAVLNTPLRYHEKFKLGISSRVGLGVIKVELCVNRHGLNALEGIF